MKPFERFTKSPAFRRILIFSALGVVLFLLRKMMNIILLTFIFTYLLYNIQHFLVENMRRVVKVSRRVVIVLLYLVVAAGIGFALYKFTPAVVKETASIIEQAYAVYKNPGENKIAQFVVWSLHQVDLNGYIDQGMTILFSSIRKVGILGIDLLIAFILSLFFQLERKRIYSFIEGVRRSRIGGLFSEIGFFGAKFLHSFGSVIQTQIVMALINTALTVPALWLLGFPKIFGLSVMVFLLGLIPFAGVVISLIPLSIIAFGAGGPSGAMKVGWLVGIILSLHFVQSYLIYPRLMSEKTELPLFLVLLVLIVGEYCFGVWGLIVGIPLFVFVLDILDIPYSRPKDAEPLLAVFKRKKRS